MHPKVFLSHASEDKVRFVLVFAEALRSKGIDVWLDRWEILPGDSLVDRIFEEGLKEADAIIVVLSKHSVDKPWVKEELNVGVVNRIAKGTKIVPVVIDDCKVPESLVATAWERIEDLENYSESFDRIVAAILGQSLKPDMGELPSYMKESVKQIVGLSAVDGVLFKVACDLCIEKKDTHVGPAVIREQTELSDEQIVESCDVLERYGYIKKQAILGRGPHSFSITGIGFAAYFETYYAKYSEMYRRVVSEIVNKDSKSSAVIADALGFEIVFVEHVVHSLENQGLLIVSKAMGRCAHFFVKSTAINRLLE